jgi:hypothetical protein
MNMAAESGNHIPGSSDDIPPRGWRDGLPVGDVPNMLSCFEFFKILSEETGDTEKARNMFFGHVLLGYYSPMFDHLTRDVGDVVYRLSDFLSDTERQAINIYPSDLGSLIVDGDRWDSLEDWRLAWERNRPLIPYFDFGHGLEVLDLLRITRGGDETATS